MKNSNDTIGNGTHDLLTCSAVPQPTALPRVPITISGANPFFALNILAMLSSDDSNLIRITNFDL